jgi:CRP-like cAMP-binding protein
MMDLKKKVAQATQPYLFQNSFIMTDLPQQDLLHIEKHAKPEFRKRGEWLFRQGTYPAGVYWLRAGKAKIFQGIEAGQRQTLYIYSDGDLIAYRQLIAGEPHPVSAILLEDSTVSLIPGDIFRGLLASSPFFTRNVLSALAREFTVWMNRMNAFKKYSVHHRLVLSLLILHEQYSKSGAPQGKITMTRTELAEFVGASLETVVRTLNKMKSKNLVSIKGRQITLQDPLTLVDILKKE